MPDFASVGLFATNKGKTGARGWRIWRRGSHVHVVHGSIVVENTYPKSFRWASGPTVVRPYKLYTAKRAAGAMRQWIAEKENKTNGHPGYFRLPRGQKILPKD